MAATAARTGRTEFRRRLLGIAWPQRDGEKASRRPLGARRIGLGRIGWHVRRIRVGRSRHYVAMPIDQQSIDVAIIGAGHNGLMAAGLPRGAACRGARATRHRRRRGDDGELIPGYRFSACSFLCYAFQPDRPRPRDAAVRLEVFELEPPRRPFPDGRHIVLYRDEART
jgi:hypothetical protein